MHDEVSAPAPSAVAVRSGTGSDGGPLLRLAADLLAAVTPDDVLDTVADRAEDLLGCSLVTASLLDPSGTRLRLVIARNTPRSAADAFREYALDSATIAGDVVLRREPILLRERAERHRRYPVHATLPIMQEATATLPLEAGDRVLGALTLAFDDVQVFGPEQVGCLTEVARMCGLALTRAAAHEAEREARRAAETEQRRLAALDRVIQALARATRYPDVVDAVLDAAADVAGVSAVLLVECDPLTRLVRTRAAVGVPVPPGSDDRFVGGGLVGDLARGLEPIFVTSVAELAADYPGLVGDGLTQQAWANLPFVADEVLVGWVSLGWDAPRAFADDDRRYLRLLGAHTGAATERVRMLERARGTVEVLQRVLLPDVMPIPGWEFATRYEPAGSGTDVGGDWFDVFGLPDGRVGLAIGDVAGKGTRAAAVMGLARSALRAYAVLDPMPGRVLDRLARYLELFTPEELITCIFAVLEPLSGRLEYATAGHPPGLLVGASGARWLDDVAADPPLGAPAGAPRATRTARVGDDGLHGDPRQVLLLYSDGLVERRRGPVQFDLDALAEAARVLTGPVLERAVHRLVRDLESPDGTVDDRALLALRRCVPAPAAASG